MKKHLARAATKALLFFSILPLPAQATDVTTYSATVRIDPGAVIGRISPGIYGQYLEHVQMEEETIYPSIWDAARGGVRTDVAAAARELSVPVVRWPGGCFADNYHWEDGIGPQANRPTRPNVHWGGVEPNHFGTDEFLKWCALAGSEPYINVNLGSGTLAEALRWLEYCNGSADTVQGRRRGSNGHEKPYGVKYWGIGNETWGKWETGHTDADTYGTSLSLWARAMRAADPSIRILGVGSEEGNDRKWDRTVLQKAGSDIDLLTVHMYGISTSYDGSEYEAFALTPAYLEDRLRRVIRTVDNNSTRTGATARSSPINIAVDEWNIRHFFDGKQNRKSPRNLQDAVFTAGFLNAMIRLSPRVEMANYVFLVNGNGALLVRGDQIIQTPLAMVFSQYAEWMTGEALAVDIQSPGVIPQPPVTGFPGKKPGPDYAPKTTPWLDAAAALHENGGIALSLVNRHASQACTVKLGLPPGTAAHQVWYLTHPDIYAANTVDAPGKVSPRVEEVGGNTITVPPHSVVLVHTKADASPAPAMQ
jgi:alpha-N-arabinofuranosidase